MLNKIGVWVTLAALVALLLWVDNKVANAHISHVQHYEIQVGDSEAGISDTKWMAGNEVFAGAYCNSTDEQLVRDMSDAVARDGLDGYIKWINGDNPCFDFRIVSHFDFGIRKVQGVLLEKMWTVTAVDGEIIEIWRFMDKGRQIGFTWFTPKIVPEHDA